MLDNTRIIDLMEERHSVRSYTDEPLSESDLATLQAEIDRCNAEGGLNISLVCDEPEAFDSFLAKYGKFSNVRNYLVLAGSEATDLNERCGYYGERLVLLAQKLELNTCWVGVTFKKRYVRKLLRKGDRLVIVVAIGHGATQGVPHKGKTVADVSSVPAGMMMPEWFERGIESALLAPTATNQQSFVIRLVGGSTADGRSLVDIASNGGTLADVDLGIVRLHFELGAGRENFAWV